MAFLVTGGAGFIGSHLIERLLSGGTEKIICLDDFNDDYDPALKRANVARFVDDPRVTLVEQSFADADAVRKLLAEHGIRHIVHLGAKAGVRSSLDNPGAYELTNVFGTEALLKAARAYPVERFVLISSSTVYGAGATVPFQEDAPLGVPLSPYGVSKRAAELLGLQAFHEHGVPVVSLRPFSVYGPRIRPDLAMWIFAEAILQSRPIPLFGDGSMRRDLTHVSDICDGLLAAVVAEGVVGQAINLGHQEPVTVRELLAMLESALGRQAVIDQRPASPADMPVTCADLTKATRLLNYRPRVALADGLREFVAWFQARS